MGEGGGSSVHTIFKNEIVNVYLALLNSPFSVFAKGFYYVSQQFEPILFS